MLQITKPRLERKDSQATPLLSVTGEPHEGEISLKSLPSQHDSVSRRNSPNYTFRIAQECVKLLRRRVLTRVHDKQDEGRILVQKRSVILPLSSATAEESEGIAMAALPSVLDIHENISGGWRG